MCYITLIFEKMIVVRNLWKKFGNTQIFAGLDLSVESGETLVILGQSGIGKSVLLKHIIGLLTPDAGTIDIDGVCITSPRSPEVWIEISSVSNILTWESIFRTS